MARKQMAQKTKSRKGAEAKPRTLEKPRYSSFKLHKKIQHDKPTLMSAWGIWKKSLQHVLKYKKLFAGITLIYLALTVVLVRGLGNTTDIPLLKETIEEVLSGGAGQVLVGVTLFGELLSSATSTTTAVASTYQSMIVIIVSLVVIWALRQTHAGSKVRVKESFYKAMYPLLPFILVLFVIGLQFIPFIMGATIFGTVVSNGLAVTVVETVLWGCLFFLLAVLSLYMVSSSVFALYIVTLPDMQPMQALRSARELVRYRRWTVLRKVLFLPCILLIIAAVVTIPIIIFLAVIAEPLFLVLTAAFVVFVHSYLYTLYRELL